MAGPRDVDVVVVGAGPNGLAAANATARAGLRTLVLEQADNVGGGCRSAELTLPGVVHDTCAAILPLAAVSPFFAELDLGRFGLAWVTPPAALAHPLDDGSAVLLARSLDETAASLGPDARAYARLVGPLVRRWDDLAAAILAPPQLPRHPLVLARFGLRALLPAATLARVAFRGERARALFAGLAAHSAMPLSAPASSAFALVLGAIAHRVGWPLVRGGSQRLSDALAASLREAGGRIETGVRVDSLDELPAARLVFLDVTPRQLLRLDGGRLAAAHRRRLSRFRYGPGVFKIDWALDGPIPWRARECLRAGTVHVGGTLEEIARAEAEVARGAHPERPFVLVAQQSLFDPTRTGDARHTGWAYCHVPNGSERDLTARIEAQMERFAPGFRDRVLARHVRTAADAERHNPNQVGGDLGGGRNDLWQVLARPVPRLVPYATGLDGVYLCSASTPPGGGVHGLCGYHAARAALPRHARDVAG